MRKIKLMTIAGKTRFTRAAVRKAVEAAFGIKKASSKKKKTSGKNTRKVNIRKGTRKKTV